MSILPAPCFTTPVPHISRKQRQLQQAHLRQRQPKLLLDWYGEDHVRTEKATRCGATASIAADAAAKRPPAAALAGGGQGM